MCCVNYVVYIVLIQPPSRDQHAHTRLALLELQVHAKDLIPAGRVQREINGDNSDKESDWLDSSSHPKGHEYLDKRQKLANRTSLCDQENGHKQLPAIYAVDPAHRIHLQKISWALQTP